MVTWAALGFGLLAIIGVLITLYGLMKWFAAGMASNPDLAIGKSGCLTALVGLAVIAGGIWGSMT